MPPRGRLCEADQLLQLALREFAGVSLGLGFEDGGHLRADPGLEPGEELVEPLGGARIVAAVAELRLQRRGHFPGALAHAVDHRVGRNREADEAPREHDLRGRRRGGGDLGGPCRLLDGGGRGCGGLAPPPTRPKRQERRAANRIRASLEILHANEPGGLCAGIGLRIGQRGELARGLGVSEELPEFVTEISESFPPYFAAILFGGKYGKDRDILEMAINPHILSWARETAGLSARRSGA